MIVNMVYLVALIVLVATVASFSRLAHEDIITAPWRANRRTKYGPDNFVNRMLECLRCTSSWVAIPFTLATILAFLVFADASALGTVLALLGAYPISQGVGYLAYVLYLRGEA